MVTAYNNVLHNNTSQNRSPEAPTIEYGLVTGGIRHS